MKRSCVERKRKFPFDPEVLEAALGSLVVWDRMLTFVPEVELRCPVRRRRFPFDPAVEVERRRPCHKRIAALFNKGFHVGREGAIVTDDRVFVVPLDRDEEFQIARIDYFHGMKRGSAIAQCDLPMTAVNSIFF